MTYWVCVYVQVCMGICLCLLERWRAGLFNSFVFLTGCLIIHVLCFGLGLPRERRQTWSMAVEATKMRGIQSVYQEIWNKTHSHTHCLAPSEHTSTDLEEQSHHKMCWFFQPNDWDLSSANYAKSPGWMVIIRNCHLQKSWQVGKERTNYRYDLTISHIH